MPSAVCMKTWDDIPLGEDRVQVYATLAQVREQYGENYAGLVFKLTRSQAEALSCVRVITSYPVPPKTHAASRFLPSRISLARASPRRR